MVLVVAAVGFLVYSAHPQNTSSTEWKIVESRDFGITFDVPGNWNTIDHAKDRGELWLEEPKSHGDGADDVSFRLVVATTSTSFPKFVSFDISEDFEAMHARTTGTMENGTTGESFEKLANMTIGGYPAVHFQIVGAVSKERGTRAMEDGLWIHVNAGNQDRNLLFYFASTDTAKRYTFYSEAVVMKRIFDSIDITP